MASAMDGLVVCVGRRLAAGSGSAVDRSCCGAPAASQQQQSLPLRGEFGRAGSSRSTSNCVGFPPTAGAAAAASLRGGEARLVSSGAPAARAFPTRSTTGARSRVRVKVSASAARASERGGARRSGGGGRRRDVDRDSEPYVAPTFVFDLPNTLQPSSPSSPSSRPPPPSPPISSPSISQQESVSPTDRDRARDAAADLADWQTHAPPPLWEEEEEEEEEEQLSNRRTPSSEPRLQMPNLLRPPPPPPNHKSGYVALIGQPNAGKSTLLNSLIGQKLSIVTRKPQTTRHRILGLCSGRDYQIVLYDTPGVIPVSAHKLDDLMMHSVRSATINADAIVLVVDITLPPQPLSSLVQAGGSAMEALGKKPCVLVLNKKDALKPGEVARKVEWYRTEFEKSIRESVLAAQHRRQQRRSGAEQQQQRSYNGDVEDEEDEVVDGEEQEWDEATAAAAIEALQVLPISAKHGHGVPDLQQWMLSKLPNGPAYYPKDVVSELPERFFVAEILREKLLLQYQQEVPYACQVNVRSFKERPGSKDFIQFDIIVEKDSQKGILLGKGGGALKALATSARLDIEEFLGRESFIEITVKVKENWRKDEKLLKEYGLSSQARGAWY